MHIETCRLSEQPTLAEDDTLPFSEDRCPIYTNMRYPSMSQWHCQSRATFFYKKSASQWKLYLSANKTKKKKPYPVREFLVCLGPCRWEEWHNHQEKVGQEEYRNDDFRSSERRIPVPNSVWWHVQEEQAKRNQGIDNGGRIRWHW